MRLLMGFIFLAMPVLAAAEEPAPVTTVWNVDRLDRLGEYPTTVLGAPSLVETKDGKAVQFDGQDDALLVDANPLAGLKQFTVEVIFQPQAAGPKEQRFLHFQEAGSENRLLFETRLTDDGQWFLDTYVKSGEHDATLFAEKSLHPIGPWYHAAVVVDGQTMRHFVGGQEELKADLPFAPLGPGQTSLGVRINKVFWYKGAVRQIKITPRALAPQEFVSLAPAAPAIVARAVKPLANPNLDEQLDLVYAKYGERELHLDLFRPKDQGDRALPAVLVVHGGGWLQGDKTRFRALGQALALRGYVAAVIEYRLGGEARFPAAVHDCNAAIRWLRANAKQYGIDPERVAAVGGSAGGHLVGLVAAAPDVRELQGDGGNAGQSSRLQAAVVLAGPMELATGPVAERSRQNPEISNTNRWLGKTIDEAPELYRLASPFTHWSKAAPPILFMHGELDHPEQNAASRRRLQELGVPAGVLVYTAGKHGCWNQHPWFEPMVDDIDAFLTSALQRDLYLQWLPKIETDWGEMRFGAESVDLLIFHKPAGGVLQIPRLNNPVKVAYVRGDAAKTPLKLSPGVREWMIDVSPLPGGAIGQTVIVETVGRPHVPTIPRVVGGSADGSIVLHAHDAVTHGENLRYEPQPHKNTVGYWTNEDDWCEWRCYVEQPGKYELQILQGCGKGQGGSEVEVQIGDQFVTFTVEDTGHFQNFKERSLGTVTLAAPQVNSLQIRAKTKAAAAVMDVRQVRLIPVAD
ncbi:MAG TPA: alpha/beta hydrolase fold domain-containing protein [Pirellulaceae bacterium]|nr:alpha/beta hydrolase fold domain-containing protein [Pirellulaceae bacterium]